MTEWMSYVEGGYRGDSGEPVELKNPATEEVVAVARCGGLDLAAALEYARRKGVPAMQALSFAERGELLGRMSSIIHDQRDMLIEASIHNGGATRSGAKFDVDGGAGTLAAYAELAAKLEGTARLADGDSVGLGRGARLQGRHCFVPRQGVAVLINAFNFPVWGFCEKAATALLAGMPVVSKPATLTSLAAARLAGILVESGALPDGAFSQVLGPITGLLEELCAQDLVAFTGSSATAVKIRGLPSLIRNSVPVNVEADSLNAAVLGPDIDPTSDCYQLFLRDVHREITEKTGQKCTATRRLVVPEPLVDRVSEDLAERLTRTRMGNPASREVEVGPLSTEQQRDDVHAGLDRLRAHAEVVCGGGRPDELIDVPDGKGFFTAPTLLVARSEAAVREVHRDEVFGPVCSVLPYSGDPEQAVDLVRKGQGMLVSSVYSDSRPFLRDVALGVAPYSGRVVLVDSRSEGFSLPVGMVLPQLIHGGPGRAGGGEELGGIRGVQHYLHRTAFQGSRGLLEKLLG